VFQAQILVDGYVFRVMPAAGSRAARRLRLPWRRPLKEPIAEHLRRTTAVPDEARLRLLPASAAADDASKELLARHGRIL